MSSMILFSVLFQGAKKKRRKKKSEIFDSRHYCNNSHSNEDFERTSLFPLFLLAIRYLSSSFALSFGMVETEKNRWPVMFRRSLVRVDGLPNVCRPFSSFQLGEFGFLIQDVRRWMETVPPNIFHVNHTAALHIQIVFHRTAVRICANDAGVDHFLRHSC